MATKGITVKELYDDLRQEILAGNGNKTILISSDDEGNSYPLNNQTVEILRKYIK